MPSTCVAVGHTWPDAIIALAVALPTILSAVSGLLAFRNHRAMKELASNGDPRSP